MERKININIEQREIVKGKPSELREQIEPLFQTSDLFSPRFSSIDLSYVKEYRDHYQVCLSRIFIMQGEKLL